MTHNQTNVNIKTLKLIFIIIFISTFIFTSLIVIYKIQTRNYKTVNATIKNVRIDDTDNTGNKRMNNTIYTTYSYEVNSKLYEIEIKTFLQKNIGKNEIIKYNPNNPKQIYNKLYVNGLIAFTLFQLLFEIILYLIIKKYHVS